MMTEQEAKTRWCPLARTALWAGTAAAAANRETGGVKPNDFAPCIGSACMAWQWGQKRNPDWKPNHGVMMYQLQHPDDEQPLYVTDETRGYCGAFGKE